MSLRSGLRCLFLYLCAVVAAFAADFRPGMVLVKYHPDATEADIAELQSRKGLRLTKHIKLFGIYAYAYFGAYPMPSPTVPLPDVSSFKPDALIIPILSTPYQWDSVQDDESSSWLLDTKRDSASTTLAPAR